MASHLSRPQKISLMPSMTHNSKPHKLPVFGFLLGKLPIYRSIDFQTNYRSTDSIDFQNKGRESSEAAEVALRAKAKSPKLLPTLETKS
jgi:hypothetical protein